MSRILAIGIVLLLVSCSPRGTGTFFTGGIQNYSGDGTILDTSERGGVFPTRSYVVALPSFPLDRPYKQSFRLDGLPIIEGKPTEIAFFVPCSFSRKHVPNAQSAVEFSITTTAGSHVTSVGSTLDKLIWSSPAQPMHNSGYALYQLDTSFFQPVAGERYRLHVNYSPEPGADGGEGRFYLWNGVGGS